MKNKFLILLVLSLFNIANSYADSVIQDAMAKWQSYIVVSSNMPHSQLVSLAREASISNTVMVLNGFTNKENSIPGVQQFISEINSECCEKLNASRWIINPKIAQRYHISSAPTFLIARGESTANGDYSLLSGDFDLANALKYFAQHSNSSKIRQQATIIYQNSYQAH